MLLHLPPSQLLVVENQKICQKLQNKLKKRCIFFKKKCIFISKKCGQPEVFEVVVLFEVAAAVVVLRVEMVDLELTYVNH